MRVAYSPSMMTVPFDLEFMVFLSAAPS